MKKPVGPDPEWTALKVRYVESSLQGAAELKIRLLEMRYGLRGREVISEGRFFIHRISGTATTFGFPRLAEVARRVDASLRQHQDAGVPPEGTVIEWEKEIDQIEAILSAESKWKETSG